MECDKVTHLLSHYEAPPPYLLTHLLTSYRPVH